MRRVVIAVVADSHMTTLIVSLPISPCHCFAITSPPSCPKTSTTPNYYFPTYCFKMCTRFSERMCTSGPAKHVSLAQPVVHALAILQQPMLNLDLQVSTHSIIQHLYTHFL